MTMLAYTLITDPAPLAASGAGRQSESTGTVYLLVTNIGQQAAFWSTISVELPVGNGAGDLTPNFSTIKPKGECSTRSGTRSSVKVQPGPQGSNAFQATAPGGRARFDPGDYMVLTLEDVTVAPTAGLAVLKVAEAASRTKTGRLSSGFAAVALLKTAPKELPVPRDFRPDKAMVDAGEELTLRWEGTADFGYEILYPGAPQPVPVSGGSWSPPDAPKRATTYILIATDPNTQRQHFLTATVQVRNPILEALTAIKGVTTPWVQGATEGDGAFTFSKGAMHVRRESGAQEGGALYAGGVRTEHVSGPDDADGDITFLPGEVKVWRNRGSYDRGALYAGEANLSGIATRYVKGLDDSDGMITFLRGVVQVVSAFNSRDRGILYAGGIRTEYVSGANDVDGDITFIPGGVKVWTARGSGFPGNLYASMAELWCIYTEWVGGRSNDNGRITFPEEGIQVSRGNGAYGVVSASEYRHYQ
ncbi:hypothetical protein [Nonomuraea rhodomycinica]|uniref:Uncharacterized protein n=1 Tax=Nonomuraea rhodomycinica TaxID=1712872 RepID=A0A7Y6IT58_9ACTN|nr:hypothetical protein [Nonomuraea rhodomycinica]NUW43917.1 hypothetical protein [Nonomuraea rhodomycinica]